MYKCSICNKSFSSGLSLGGHKGSHKRSGMIVGKYSRKWDHECEWCHKKFFNKKRSKYCSSQCFGLSRSNKFLESRNNLIIFKRTRKFISEYKDNIENCEICGKSKDQELRVAKRSFAVDHDHLTGEFRGILCCACNSKLDWFIDNSKSIEEYLSRDNPH